MSGFLFFAHDCAKSVLCCFPRVLSWFKPYFNYVYRYAYVSSGVRVFNASDETVLGSEQRVKSVPTIPGYRNLPDDEQSEWVFFATCQTRSYGIRADGSLWGWGNPPLGDGSMQESAVPRLIDEGPWTHVSTSETHTLAIKSDGTLWAWGDNTYGQLGNGRHGVVTVWGPQHNFVRCRAKLSAQVGSVNIAEGGLYKKRPTVEFVPQVLPSATISSLGYYAGNPGPRNARGLWVNNETYNPENASGAAGEPVMAFTLRACSVDSAGSGYTSVPKATVTSDESVDSHASVTLVGSFSIASVAVVDGGSGYTSQPSFAIDDLHDGSGFSAEAVIDGGVIRSVNVTSGGSGYRTSASGETFLVSVHGGGGSGATLVARLRDGFVLSANVTSAGSGYDSTPTIEVSGGGGSGAVVSGDWRGPVVGVRVTSGGSGYTEIRDSSGTVGEVGLPWYRERYINVAFDRAAGDDLTTPAVAIATIAPSSVQEVSVVSPVTANNLSNSFFDARDGIVGEFTIDDDFTYKTDSQPGVPDVPQQVDARIVGGGLSWANGIPVQATYSSVTKSVTLSYDGSSTHAFTSQPYVLVKASSPIRRPARDSFGNATTLTIKSGTNWKTYLNNLRGDVEFDVISLSGKTGSYVGGVGYQPCVVDACGGRVVEHNDHDVIGDFNAIGAGVVNGAFSVSANLTGEPTAQVGSGNAKLSLLSNFDGTCTFTVDNPGNNYRRWAEESETSTQTVYWCNGSAYTAATWTRTTTTASLNEGPPKLLLDYEDVSPAVAFTRLEIPSSAWVGPRRSEGFVYASFGDGVDTDFGLWKLTRDGSQLIKQGGLHIYEPPVRSFASLSPIPEQIEGQWLHAYAAGNGGSRDNQFWQSFVDAASGRPLSYAINNSGELYLWGMANNPNYCSPPSPSGRPVSVSCDWIADEMPRGQSNQAPASWTVAGSRFFVLDPPQSVFGEKPSVVNSTRWCDNWSIYPPTVPKSFFGGGADRIYNVAFADTFSGDPSTPHYRGMGYTQPPEIFFHAQGEPLLTVSASLVEVPEFSECNGISARSADGQLWSLIGGWSITGRSPRMTARRATFDASGLYDSWSALFIASQGVRDHSFSPSAASQDATVSLLKSTRSPGDIMFGGAWCGATASVQHSTVEQIETVSGYAIIFDDGGSGFDDYSTWQIKITHPSVVSIEYEIQPTTTFDSGALPRTERAFRPYHYKLAVAQHAANAITASCTGSAFNNPAPNPNDWYDSPQEVNVRNSVSHETKFRINRESPNETRLDCWTWKGSVYVYPSSLNPPGGAFLSSPAANVLCLSGVYEDGDEPVVSFECVSGSNSYSSLPSYRIVPIRGVLSASPGLARVDGVWSDFDMESSSRKISYAPFPGAKGVKAPESERHYLMVRGGVGLKEDGSLWLLGSVSDSTLAAASRVMGNLEAKVINSGGGYTRPVNATLSSQLEGVARATATVNGRLVAIGVENGGSYYRTPPTLTISGGATADAVIAGPVDSVEVSSGGSGYKCPPRVRFSRPGFSAFGTAVMSGHIESVVIADPGSGYQEPPEVTFEGDGGSGATATATIKGAVASVTVSNSGSGYKSPPRVVFSGGGGSGAEAFAVMRRDGTRYRVASVQVVNGGHGYSSPPTVEFTGGGGTGAAGTAVLNAQIDTITVTSPGDGYKTHPEVKISGSASAFAIASMSVKSVDITDGGSYRSPPTVSFTAKKSVASVSLSSEGSGYTSAPEVLIAGGVGSGAKAVCTISATLSKINVVSGGYGYSQARPPRVVLTGGYDLAEGSPASARATVNSSGQISAITVTSAGSAYRSAPKVSFEAPVMAVLEPVVEGGAIVSITVISGGYGYGAAPTIAITGGTGATATASINQDGKVTSVTVTNGGSGYSSSATAVAVYAFAGAEANAVAELSGVVDKITLTAVGSGYDDDAPPSVMFIGGGGDGATASVTLEAAGSGGSGTTKINGSVIYAKIKSQGSGYQDNPTITVSGGDNEKIRDLNQRLEMQEITQEQYQEQISTYRAVLRCGIAGPISSMTIDDAGENYLSGSRPVDGPTCDRHGKRKSGGVTLSGYTYGSSRTATASIQTSTDSNGGGVVTSINLPTEEFCGNPAVHFCDTVGVVVETRARVSSVGVAKGSPWDQNQYDITSGSASPVSFDVMLGSSQTWRGALSDACSVTMHSHDITPVFFRGRYSSPADKIKYKRAPSFVVESELGSGAASEVLLDEDGFIVDALTNVKADNSMGFVRVSGQTSPYSSGVIGRTEDPGMRDFTPPTVTVTVQDGKVFSATLQDLGDMTMFDFQPGVYDAMGELVVHGGGGTGAKLYFDYSAGSVSGQIRVVNGGSGYTSTPQVTFVPHLAIGESNRLVYGPEYGRRESSWETWPLSTQGAEYQPLKFRVEYVEGSTGDGYATLYGNVPVTSEGIYPMLSDGFVSAVGLTDGGVETTSFAGPAFVQHFTTPPTASIETSGGEEAAEIDISVVNWSTVFTGGAGGSAPVMAVRAV